MKKTLYLMRHGQTFFNLRGKIQGSCDSPLTELGKKQAKIAGLYFKENGIKIDHAYCSTQERASDTLELVINMPYTRVKGIKEWNFGTFEGEPEYLVPHVNSREFGDFFKFFGGETNLEVQERANSTLTNIIENDNHNVVLAVSHAAVCHMFLDKWEPNAPFQKIENCTIFEYEFENGKFSLVKRITHDFDREI